MAQKPLNLARDSPDEDDLYLSIDLRHSEQLDQIDIIDYRPLCPPVSEQGAISSCTAHALACIFYFNQKKNHYVHVFEPSRLFIYYNTRLMKQTIDTDDGGSLRDTLKAIYNYGVCPEEMWPYDISMFQVEPPLHVYKYALRYDAITYFRVPQVLSHLCQCLMDGYLFAFGMSVYSNFEYDIVNNGGYVSVPSESDIYYGGHAVCAVGFDNIKKVFIIRNSWGATWGQAGYFYLPFSYLVNPDLVYDIWTFRNKVEKLQEVPQLVDQSTSPIPYQSEHQKCRCEIQ